jgi:hypothetical protein
MTEEELQKTRDKMLVFIGKLLLNLHEKYIKKEEWDWSISEKNENQLWDAIVELENHYKHDY